MKFKPRRKLNHDMFVKEKSNKAFYVPINQCSRTYF